MDLSFFFDGRALLFLVIASSFYYFILDNNQLQKFRRGRACRIQPVDNLTYDVTFLTKFERLIIWTYWLVGCKCLLNLLNLHSKKIKKGSG